MEYIEKLKTFKGLQDKAILENQFEKLARYFLTEGYFLVNGSRKIYICDVEFYYHEEKGPIKDYAMYHRNDRDNKDPRPSYFPIGQFNAHTSGIDITFENELYEYRVGMLIRGFKIEGIDAPNGQQYDRRSTYFYEALLNHGTHSPAFTIEWIIGSNPYKLEPIHNSGRINIKKYDDSGAKTDLACDRKWRFHFKLRK